MRGTNTRRSFHLLVGATLTIATSIVGSFLTSSLTGEQSWWFRLGWLAAGIAVTFYYLRWQLRSQEGSLEAIKVRVSQLASELRKQVRARSYGARRQLIEAPLRELDLDMTPRVDLVRDPRLIQPEPLSEKIADDIVAAFESSKRRLLIVGDPGSGKTMAAYSLIEYLDEREGDEVVQLLVNLSAWEAQDDFETFLVDYLCSSVGYEVHERAVAEAFINSDRYSLILDGLDEIPVGLRAHFSERLDEFVTGLPGEVGVVVTCRTREYEVLKKTYPEGEGLGLVQAVEILPLTSEQLDSALTELAKVDQDWRTFLSQRNLAACQRARGVLSNPMFLNLAVVGRLRPRKLLECDEEQELQNLVLSGYLDRTLADQREYEPADARCYLSWIALFLNGAEVSPFGLKTSDSTVFDLANLTPREPPRRYRLFEVLGLGIVGASVAGLFGQLFAWGLFVWGLVGGLVYGVAAGLVGGLVGALLFGLVVALLIGPTQGMVVALFATLTLGLVGGTAALMAGGTHHDRFAVSSHLTLVWPPTREQRHDFLRVLGLGLFGGLLFGLLFGLVGWGVTAGGAAGLVEGQMMLSVMEGTVRGAEIGLSGGLFGGLFGGLATLFEPRSVLITSRTPKEASSRSLSAALVFGLVGALLFGLGFGLTVGLLGGMTLGLALGVSGGLVVGVGVGLPRGGWFLLLQKVAHRRLAWAGNLPPHPGDFLEWGIEKKFFRQVGGGVRYRHNLIQQHLASTSEGVS